MESIKFCSHCGGLLEKGFLFCPYCGAELTEKFEPASLLDGPFKRMEAMTATVSLRRLEGCRDALDHLERELDDFLSRPKGVEEGEK